MIFSGNIEMVSKELPDRKLPITLGKGEWEAIRRAQEMGEGAVLATDDRKAIKWNGFTACCRNLSGSGSAMRQRIRCLSGW